jgi:hypothetical protein
VNSSNNQLLCFFIRLIFYFKPNMSDDLPIDNNQPPQYEGRVDEQQQRPDPLDIVWQAMQQHQLTQNQMMDRLMAVLEAQVTESARREQE